MVDRIRLSWDELHSAEVDRQLAQNTALSQAQNHYHQRLPEGVPADASGNPSPSMWFNPFVYSALAGLIGGVLAWIPCEVVWQRYEQASSLRQYTRIIVELDDLQRQRRDGEVSSTEAILRDSALRDQLANNPRWKIETDVGSSEEDRRRRLEPILQQESWRRFATTIAFLAIGGAIIAGALSAAEPVVVGNWRQAIIQATWGLLFGCLGGIAIGLICDSIYRWLGAGEASFLRQLFARSVTWALVGLSLAMAPGLTMGSWKRVLIGMIGGGLGGIAGGLLFDPIGFATGSALLSRLVGLSAIGIAAGLGTAFVEQLAKTGWLKVVAGLIVGKQFILYRQLTQIGSSPQCDIYLFKDAAVAPMHAAIHLLPTGGYELESQAPGFPTLVNGEGVLRRLLTHGDQIQIGGTALLFEAKQGK